MAIFTIIPISKPEAIGERLKQKKAEGVLDCMAIPGSPSYFVSYSGTSIELAELTGITDASVGTGVVVAASAYYGRGPTDMWDWVKSRWDS